jgi:parallel beta-helix repeat protein
MNPRNPAVVASTIVDGGAFGSVFDFRSGEGPESVLTGLTITGGYDAYGGGIECWNASPTLVHNDVVGNEARDNGGGIFCGDSSRAVIEHNTVAGNAAANGAGIYCFLGSSPPIRYNRIRDNIADTKGGGLRCYQESSPKVTNNIITGNHAVESGGGIALDWSSSPSIINNVVSENSSDYRGGGIRCVNSNTTVINTILWDNEAPTGPAVYIGGFETPSIFAVSYSDLEGGAASVYVEPSNVLDWGPGMIDADPLFATVHRFEYVPGRGSPCIDAGDPLIEDGLFDDHPRWPPSYPDGPRSDIGGYGGPMNFGWLR